MLERSCGAVVYTEQKGVRQYVLVKGGYIGLPKGHMEEGESERDTAVREVFEETCVKTRLIPGFRRWVLYHMPNGNDKRVVYFLATFENQEAHRNPDEFLKVLVMEYPEAIRALTFENDRATLRAAEGFLQRSKSKSRATSVAPNGGGRKRSNTGRKSKAASQGGSKAGKPDGPKRQG